MIGFITHSINNNIINEKLYYNSIIQLISSKYNNNNYFIALQNTNKNNYLEKIINLLPPEFDNFADLYNKEKNLVILYNTEYNKLLYHKDFIINNNYIQIVCFKEIFIFINILFCDNYKKFLQYIYNILNKLSKKINVCNYKIIINGNFTNHINKKLNFIINNIYNKKQSDYKHIINYIKLNDLIYYGELLN